MRILPYATAALALGRSVASAEQNVTCKMPVNEDHPDLQDTRWRLGLPFLGGGKVEAATDGVDKRASGQSFTPYSTQNGMCLDVQNNRMQSGSAVQLWQCSGGENQKWRIEGPLFQTSNNLCLDVVDGKAFNSAKLQVWTCDGNNPNQKWSKIGDTLQWQGEHGKYCLDVKDGLFRNGNLMQLWTCYPGSAHQSFTSSQAASMGGTSTGATNFYGYNCISLDAFVKKYPQCAPYKGALQSAGADQEINPVFLGAIAMIESSCGAGLHNSPHAWAGPFQFMHDGAANLYIGAGRSRLNFWDSAYGAARYFKALLAQTNGNLYQAMRNYNGDPANGGEPQYQAWAAGYMAGTR